MAHANWLSTFCNKYLVADDPYQFETASQAWIDTEIERLEIKRRWNTATINDVRYLQLLFAEQRRRDFFIELNARESD